MHQQQEWLTADEVVARYRLKNRQALYLLRTRGRGPKGYRIGRQMLFKETDLLAWEESRADRERTSA